MPRISIAEIAMNIASMRICYSNGASRMAAACWTRDIANSQHYYRWPLSILVTSLRHRHGAALKAQAECDQAASPLPPWRWPMASTPLLCKTGIPKRRHLAGLPPCLSITGLSLSQSRRNCELRCGNSSSMRLPGCDGSRSMLPLTVAQTPLALRWTE